MDWFNAVDTTYQHQLRELNDLNWERFKAEMDARFARSEATLNEKLSNLKSDLMKWMFIYWSGSILSLGGLMIALLR